ncbi:DUF1499 domain-containing protein [Psychromonas antarctica]|jgi:uncharacterized protein (DUF1499 family)|uniref:DUF1499 domain-containing protein n=1 Tax=Psychromonas antarctica TaxID=67573 RepID=UPI001EE825EC|nr:DUF1499 domain-containing protein [Psychromonas antarctica]MCG6202267.1 DUF1499 domain-containing protein [Psychromonas antarctica]
MTILISVLILISIAFFGRIYYQNAQVPNLGVNNGKLAEISSKPNNVSSQTDDENKKVATMPFKKNQRQTMVALKKAVQQFGGGKIEKESDDYLYVIFTTSLMRYHDDVEFWLDAKNEVVHFRSASRAGHSDMGVNRQRWEKLNELYGAL